MVDLQFLALYACTGITIRFELSKGTDQKLKNVLIGISDEDPEDPQKENASSDEVASRLQQLHIARPTTAFRPTQPFIHLIPPVRPQFLLPKPNLPLQFSAPSDGSEPLSGAAFKRQRDRLVADMFKE